MPPADVLPDLPEPDPAGQAEPESLHLQPDQSMSLGPEEPSNADQSMPDFYAPVEVPVPQVSSNQPQPTAKPRAEHVFEMSLEVVPEDINDNPMCLWGVLDECFQVTPKSKLRRVEVSFRKLPKEDQQLFEQAMKKEWNSWIENKVTSLCK